MSEKLPSLGNKAPDRVAAALRAIVSAVPFAGGILTEIINEIIPNQRLDRVESFLIALSQAVEKSGLTESAYPTNEGPKLELLEAGMRAAAGTSSKEKIQYLANCVANGITEKESETIRFLRVTRIISELDAEEMIVLLSYTKQTIAEAGEFRQKYPEIFALAPLVMGASPKVVKDHAAFEAAKGQLISLGLLSEEIEFDRDSGAAKTFGGRTQKQTGITLVGRLVLFHAGLSAEV